jgi:hypothetical protein
VTRELEEVHLQLLEQAREGSIPVHMHVVAAEI